MDRREASVGVALGALGLIAASLSAWPGNAGDFDAVAAALAGVAIVGFGARRHGVEARGLHVVAGLASLGLAGYAGWAAVELASPSAGPALAVLAGAGGGLVAAGLPERLAETNAIRRLAASDGDNSNRNNPGGDPGGDDPSGDNPDGEDLDRSTWGHRLLVTVQAFGLGLLGFVAIVLWSLVLLVVATAAVGDPGPVVRQVLGSVGLGLGTGTVALGYLRVTDRDRDFVDVRWPDVREVAWALGGVVLLFAVLLLLDQLFAALSVDPARHDIERLAREGDPALLLALIPAAYLLIGPGEELLFRNVIQKSLAEVGPTWAAIGVSSVVFALAHGSAYAGAGASTLGVAASLVVVFCLSVVLGAVYARTRNVLVPAFVHGSYDAIQFGLLYLQLTGGG